MALPGTWEELSEELIAEIYKEAGAAIHSTQRNSANASSNTRKDKIHTEFQDFLQQCFRLRDRTMMTCEPIDVLTFIIQARPWLMPSKVHRVHPQATTSSGGGSNHVEVYMQPRATRPKTSSAILADMQRS